MGSWRPGTCAAPGRPICWWQCPADPELALGVLAGWLGQMVGMLHRSGCHDGCALVGGGGGQGYRRCVIAGHRRWPVGRCLHRSAALPPDPSRQRHRRFHAGDRWQGDREPGQARRRPRGSLAIRQGEGSCARRNRSAGSTSVDHRASWAGARRGEDLRSAPGNRVRSRLAPLLPSGSSSRLASPPSAWCTRSSSTAMPRATSSAASASRSPCPSARNARIATSASRPAAMAYGPSPCS